MLSHSIKLIFHFFTLLAIIILINCASTTPPVILTQNAEFVKVFRMNDPPIACREIIPIEVYDGEGCGAFGAPGNYANAYNKFRNKVIEVGGNAAQVQSETPPHSEPNCYVNAYYMRGIVFKCPDSLINATK